MSMILMLALAATQPVADPMAPAKEGKAQCRSPDDSKKTCRSLGMYKANPDGSYTSDTMLMIAPGITIQTSSVVTVKNGAMCGTLTAKQVQEATLFDGPAPMEAAKAAIVRERIMQGMAPMLGKQVCTTFTPRADGAFDTSATVDGVARPDMTLVVRWVTSDDGYMVGQ